MTLQKGIQIGQTLVGLGQGIRSTIKAAKADATEEQADIYLADLMQDKHPEAPLPPQAEGPEAAGPAIDQPVRKPEIKDPKALAKAYNKWYSLKLQDQSFRANELKMQDELTQRKRVETEELWKQYNGMLRAGNDKEADTLAVMIYNKFPNGDTLDYDKATGKVYKMKERNGTLDRGEQTELPSREKMANIMEDMLGKEKYNQTYVGQYRANKASNAQALEAAKRVVDKDGNFVGWMAEYVDPETGQPDWQFSANFDEGTEKWSDARDREGLRLESEYLGKQKAQADIAEVKSKTKTRPITERRLQKAADAKAAGFKHSPDYFRALDYVRTNQFDDLQTAMAAVRAEDTIPERIRMANDLIEKIDLTDDHAKAKRAAIIKSFGVTADDVNPLRAIGHRRSKAKFATTETGKSERVKTGKGVTGLTAADYTNAELTKMYGEIQKLVDSGKTKAQATEEVRNKYDK